MASLSCILANISTRCSINKAAGHEPHKKNYIKFDVTSSFPSFKVDWSTHKYEAADATSDFGADNSSYIDDLEILGNTHTMNQPEVDPYPQAFNIEGSLCSRHTVAIRSYEVGADGTASIEAILNLILDSGVNHSGMFSKSGGIAQTEGMIRNSLIWVAARMQVQVDRYPSWGEIIEIDTWFEARGKHGMQSKWLLRNQSTGHVFASAASKLAMMNIQTRRLSKMPDEVRAELQQWFHKKESLQEDYPEKIEKLDQNSKHVIPGLKPRWSDLDMFQHINNVKYARWMLKAIPDKFMKNHALSEIIMMFKSECGISDVFQSLCEPDDEGGLPVPDAYISYTHLLQTEGDSKNEEIVRGRTRWKRKKPHFGKELKSELQE